MALSQAIVSAVERELAHEYEPGTRALFSTPTGQLLEVTVTELDMARW